MKIPAADNQTLRDLTVFNPIETARHDTESQWVDPKSAWRTLYNRFRLEANWHGQVFGQQSGQIGVH